MIDWGKYPNFKRSEFACQHCGSEGIKEELVAKLQELRNLYGKPMTITSGYRCPLHPVERKKNAPGTHAEGIAADVGVQGEAAIELLHKAITVGFKGIGVQQKGTGRFIHLDIGTGPTRPALWSY